jgi:arsenite oxidase small subunit
MEKHQTQQNPSRRNFLKAAFGSSMAAMITGYQTPTRASQTGPPSDAPVNSPQGAVEQLDAYPRVKLGTVSELETGDVQTFSYPLKNQQNFLAKLGEEALGGVGPENSIVAFNSACTHAGCSVAGQVVPQESRAGPCPCHFTSFDLSKNGLVVLGQATTDLPQVRLTVENGDIIATGIDELIWGYHDNLRNGEPIDAVSQTVTGEETTTSQSDTTQSETTTQSGSTNLESWFENVSNYDGVVDQTNTDQVTVAVGAEGNGGNFAFDLAAIQVSTGTTVTWEWTGQGGSHNVIADDGSFESELTTQEGFTFEQTFSQPGTTLYYCTPHRGLGMKGAVVVK